MTFMIFMIYDISMIYHLSYHMIYYLWYLCFMLCCWAAVAAPA